MTNKKKQLSSAGVKKEKNTELIKRTEIEGTPFVVVEIDEKECILTLGKYRMTNKTFSTFEETQQYVINEKWELLATYCSIVVTETIKQLKNQ